MKKIATVFVIILIILTAIFLVGRTQKKPETSAIPEKKTDIKTELQNPAADTVVNKILEKRPYVILRPRNDGRAVNLELENITDMKGADYELIYLTNGLERGVIGHFDIEKELVKSGKIFRELLLGSCSRNVCKYDENVEGGNLTLRYTNSDGETEEFRTDFSLQKTGNPKTEIGVEGRAVSLKLTSGSGGFIVSLASNGLPKNLTDKKIVGGPFSFFSSAGSGVGGVLNWKQNKKWDEAVSLFGWDFGGGQWEEFKYEIGEDESLQAKITKLATFILVQ
ncbi:MAG: hypothetical protein Q8N98_04135 [bacterium]|nr:hypothetical protein [bacterium]